MRKPYAHDWQEPGSNADVKKFAQGYGAKFPLFAKIDVNGPNTAPLYAYMKKEQGSFPSADIKWNFGSACLCLTLPHPALPFRLCLLLSIRPFEAEGRRAENAEFLIDKSGKCVNRFAPTDSPLSLAGEIDKLL